MMSNWRHGERGCNSGPEIAAPPVSRIFLDAAQRSGAGGVRSTGIRCACVRGCRGVGHLFTASRLRDSLPALGGLANKTGRIGSGPAASFTCAPVRHCTGTAIGTWAFCVRVCDPLRDHAVRRLRRVVAGGNGKLYWIRQPRFGGWIYGSFVNHGNYAGLMELLAPIPLVLCLGGLVRGGGRFLLGIVAVLTATTIFLSGSRGGMLAFAVQVVVLAAWLLLPSRRTGLAAGLALVLISALGLVALASRGQVLGRFGEKDGLRA